MPEAPAAAAIRVATDLDAQAWDRYLSSAAAGSFYHRFGWRKILQESLGHEAIYLVAEDGGRIAGVLPLVLVSSRLFGRILCSMPFLNYGGPCADTPAIAKALIDDAIRRADGLAVDYLELRCAAPFDVPLPVSHRKVSLTLALDADPDRLWNGFSAKHRKNIRRAYKNGLSVQAGGIELLDRFYPVLERSWRDLGTPFYRRDYFRCVLERFPESTRIYLCNHGERAVAVALVGFHGGTAEGLWQGGLPEARPLDANYVLYWEMIRDVCTRGCAEFHLGRSTAESGSEWFKSRWNAEARQLWWYFHRPGGGPMPALNVDNPRYRLAIALWRRLPLWMVRRLGPGIARGIP